MNTVTKTFTITATPDTMRRFEHFMCFLHYNGGHSGMFAMTFDGDGHERFKSEPAPEKLDGLHHLINTGQELELAQENCFKSFSLNRDKHHYVADRDGLFKVFPDGTRELRRVMNSDGTTSPVSIPAPSR